MDYIFRNKMSIEKFDAKLKLGFIGAGNMAKAIIEGLLRSQAVTPDQIYISHPSAAKTKTYAHLNVQNEVESNTFVVEHCDFIILCVKPQVLEYVCKSLLGSLDPSRHLIVSIAAGVNLEKLAKFLDCGTKLRLSRCTLNTAALIGSSCSVFSHNGSLSESDKHLVNKLLSSVGPCMGEIKGRIDVTLEYL